MYIGIFLVCVLFSRECYRAGRVSMALLFFALLLNCSNHNKKTQKTALFAT